MKVGQFDFTKSNKLYDSCKFTICRLNSKYDEETKRWTVQLPEFFVNNEADYRQIKINQFIYYTPNGCSDLGTTFHSEDLFDGNYAQPELDYFIGVSGNSINGLYTLQSRKRTLSFWFKDYVTLQHTYGDKEEYTDYLDNETKKTDYVNFFIQGELFY